ncbi:MAG: TerC family protein [Syntrophomonadaceae bacterium]|jgi:YjbE family integral membrane protein|nr:TerC family protein [Syntrophomonadaceae bacterium]
MEFVTALLSMILLNIVLSGDNAVVIALASRDLPGKQKKQAIFWGSALAVILRVILCVVVTYLLRIPYLQFIGGLALVYIGYHLLAGGDDDPDVEAGSNLNAAIKTILFADLIMSLDNVLALAAKADGNWTLLIIGLAISVPIVIFGASILSNLMNRFPVIVYVGAGLIAYTAAEMMLKDEKLGHYLEPLHWIFLIVVTLGVVALGYWSAHKKRSKKEISSEAAAQSIKTAADEEDEKTEE